MEYLNIYKSKKGFARKLSQQSNRTNPKNRLKLKLGQG